MQIIEIHDSLLFDSFVAESSTVHYKKTSMWGEFEKKENKGTPHLLGFYDGDILKATAMALISNWKSHKYIFIPYGPCMDYSNTELSAEVFDLLKQYASEQKAEFLRMDPNVVRLHRDIAGNAADDGFSNESVTEHLISSGFVHKGYGYAYDGSWNNRYTLIVDLSDSMESVRKGFNKSRITSLNRHAAEGVTTHVGSAADIEQLMAFEKQLSEQDGFKPHSKEFFMNIMNCFKENAVLYVTQIDLSQMITGIQEELNSNKYAKDREAADAKNAELAKARELIAEYGQTVPIACGLFIRIGSVSWDLYTYNRKQFNFIKPVDNLHNFAMEDMKKHGVEQYDMCGFSGSADPKDPYYGLYCYKKSFGPSFIEHIGEFDFILNQKAYEQFIKQYSFNSRLHRKIDWIMNYNKKKAKPE